MRALLLSIVLILPAFAPSEDLWKVARENALAQRKANLARDLAWFEASQTPDYVSVDVHGKRSTKAQALAGTRNSFMAVRYKTLDAKVADVKPEPKGMVAVLDVSMTADFRGTPQAKWLPMTGKALYEQHWTQQKGRWRMRLQKTLKMALTFNGKPVAP